MKRFLLFLVGDVLPVILLCGMILVFVTVCLINIQEHTNVPDTKFHEGDHVLLLNDSVGVVTYANKYNRDNYGVRYFDKLGESHYDTFPESALRPKP